MWERNRGNSEVGMRKVEGGIKGLRDSGIGEVGDSGIGEVRN